MTNLRDLLKSSMITKNQWESQEMGVLNEHKKSYDYLFIYLFQILGFF